VIAIGSGALFAIRGLGSSGADPVAEAAAAISVSHSATLLERERQHLILDSASRTMNLIGTPKVAANPVSNSTSGSVGAVSQAAAGAAGAAGAAPSASAGTAAAPDPGTAQAIAYSIMGSYGFPPSSQWSCLDALWNQESGWNYEAENASGAYGIPQALPGSKMVSAGADWATDPKTQIIWGLGYIKSLYGTPCGAWAHEEADGWY